MPVHPRHTIRLTLGRSLIDRAENMCRWYGKSCSVTSLVRRSLEMMEDELENLESIEETEIERGAMSRHVAARPSGNPHS